MGADRGCRGRGTRCGDSSGHHILAPFVNHIVCQHTRGVEHVESGSNSRRVPGDDLKDTFHATVNDMVLKGTNGGDNGTGIGFIRHTKEKFWRVTQTFLAEVLDGSHGLVILEDISVKHAHTMGASGFLVESTGAMSSPHSSNVFASNARLYQTGSGGLVAS